MVNYAEECLKLLYPKAKINAEQTTGITGWFEMTVVTKDGKKTLVHSKKNGQGGFGEKNCYKVMEQIKNIVEI